MTHVLSACGDIIFFCFSWFWTIAWCYGVLLVGSWAKCSQNHFKCQAKSSVFEVMEGRPLSCAFGNWNLSCVPYFICQISCRIFRSENLVLLDLLPAIVRRRWKRRTSLKMKSFITILLWLSTSNILLQVSFLFCYSCSWFFSLLSPISLTLAYEKVLLIFKKFCLQHKSGFRQCSSCIARWWL